MHLSGHSWFARSGTSSPFHHQIPPGLTATSMCSTSKCVSSSAHSVSPLPDRLSQLQLNVVGSVGTLPAVCDTFCLWIDPAVGRWIIRNFFFSLSHALMGTHTCTYKRRTCIIPQLFPPFYSVSRLCSFGRYLAWRSVFSEMCAPVGFACEGGKCASTQFSEFHMQK